MASGMRVNPGRGSQGWRAWCCCPAAGENLQASRSAPQGLDWTLLIMGGNDGTTAVQKREEEDAAQVRAMEVWTRPVLLWYLRVGEAQGKAGPDSRDDNQQRELPHCVIPLVMLNRLPHHFFAC